MSSETIDTAREPSLRGDQVSPHLLDASVLIALTVAEHEDHQRVSRWAAGIDSFAVCPIAEGALIRFLVRIGESAAAAADLVRAVHRRPGVEFWPDSLSYIDAHLTRVTGHRQVTDAYLASLAEVNGGLLATLDEPLAKQFPKATVLVPR